MSTAGRWTVWSISIWVVSWILIWLGNSYEGWDKFVFEPAVVALSLGFVALAMFGGIYASETDNKMRSAIAGSFVFLFVLLIIYLLAIPEFRGSLGDIASSTEATTTTPATGASQGEAAVSVSLVRGLFDTFKWVVTAIVGFYFAAGAAESITKKTQEAKTDRTEKEVAVRMEEAAVRKEEMEMARARLSSG